MEQLDRSRFGPNVWLVDELYARYVIDPSSIGDAWREFFEGYRPRRPVRTGPRPDTAEEGAERAHADGDGVDPSRQPSPSVDADAVPLRGAAGVLARRMDESLSIPTATSVRTIPARLLELNRRLINRLLER